MGEEKLVNGTSGQSNKEFVVRLLGVILGVLVFMVPVIYYTGRMSASVDQIKDDVRGLHEVIEKMRQTDSVLTENQKMVIENQRSMMEALKEMKEMANGRSSRSIP